MTLPTFRSRLGPLVLAGVLATGLLVGCGDDGSPLPAAGETPVVTNPVSTSAPEPQAPAPAATTPAGVDAPTATEPPAPPPAPPPPPPPIMQPSPAPTSTEPEPEIEIPTGVLVVVPTQNREDPSKQQFQAEVVNGTHDRFVVRGVQLRWDGFTTPVAERDDTVVGGQTIDFPLPFPGADCPASDERTGPASQAPGVDRAIVMLTLDDGRTLEVPVIDKWHVIEKLYLDDCARQWIDSLVGIEWADLAEAQFEDRPVTEGLLRLTRRNATGTITVHSVSGTIPYNFEAIGRSVDEIVLALDRADDVAEQPVRFLESRCDPHALAEIKQPYKFIAQVDVGDGVLRPYIIYPDQAMWIPMRLTADAACQALGLVEFVGG